MTTIAGFSGKYRWLSNFCRAEINWDGDKYASVEHAYQAAKCKNLTDRKLFQAEITPGQAKKLSRSMVIREDWDVVKKSIMLRLVRNKFMTHANLAEKLLDTGDSHIEETNSWGDRYWGICDGVGENHLGRILMKVRSELND